VPFLLGERGLSMKRHRILWITVGLLAVLAAGPFAYYLCARLRGEHFYRGLPTSYWRREVRRWCENPTAWSPSRVERLLNRVLRQHRYSEEPVVLKELRADPRVLPVLLDLMHDDDLRVRHEVTVRVAHFISHPDILPRVVTAMLESTEPRTALLLTKGLKDADPRIRQEVVLVLGALGPASKEATPALVEALDDENISVRLLAADALHRVDLESFPLKAVSLLIRALGDPGTYVRLHAVQILHNWGPYAKPAIARLVEVAQKDEDEEVRDAAAEAVKAIDPQAGLAKGAPGSGQ
jgi:HEAT repeat protein